MVPPLLRHPALVNDQDMVRVLNGAEPVGNDNAGFPGHQLPHGGSLRGAYAMVLQDTWLFQGTVCENIAYGREGAAREDVVFPAPVGPTMATSWPGAAWRDTSRRMVRPAV